MDRQSIITNLKILRMELEDGVDLVADMPEATLMLSDVCAYLGLSAAETAEVLGLEVSEAIKEWIGARLWQPAEKETTAQPSMTKLAVAPA